MLDDIKSLSILDVAQKLGINHRNGRGNVPCFKGHDSSTNSFSFDVNTNTFKCFGCGIGGDTMDLVTHKLNYSTKDFKLVLQWFSDNFGLSPDYEPFKKIRLQDILESEKRIDERELKNDFLEDLNNELAIDRAVMSKAYLNFVVFCDPALSGYFITDRGLTKEVIKENVIFEINKENIINFVTKKLPFSNGKGFFYDLLWLLFTDIGVHPDQLELYIEKSGLMSIKNSSYGIPFFNGKEVVYIQGVNTSEYAKSFSKYSYLGKVHKPLLFIPISMQTDDGNIKNEVDDVFVTEGIIDCLSLIVLGMNSVAITDAGLRDGDERLSEFDKLYKKNVYLLLDNDNPGEKAKQIIADYMISGRFEVRVRDLQSIAENIGIAEHIKDSNDLLLKIKKGGLLPESES